MVFVLVIVVVVFFAFGASAATRPPGGPGDGEGSRAGAIDGGKGGGIDMGKVGAAAGSVVALGASIYGALGVGGGTATAATGATATGTTVAATGASATETGATVAEGGATAAEATEASSDIALAGSVAEAVVGGLVFVVIYVLVVGSIELDKAISGQESQWRTLTNKGRLLLGRWFLWEEICVQRYLDALADSRGGAGTVAMTRIPLNQLDVPGFDFNIDCYGYVVDSITDPQASVDVRKVRTVARWQAILRQSRYNSGVATFQSTLAGYSVPGVPPSDVNSMGLSDADYASFANDYLRLQPLAQPWLEGGSFVGAGGRFGATQAVGAPVFHSYQPGGDLEQHDVESLTNEAARLLGPNNFAQSKLWMVTLGEAAAMTIAAVTGYCFAWPGDWDFTIGIVNRCGFAWSTHVAVHNPSGKLVTVALNDEGSMAMDVMQSGKQGRMVLYPRRDLRLDSAS